MAQKLKKNQWMILWLAVMLAVFCVAGTISDNSKYDAVKLPSWATASLPNAARCAKSIVYDNTTNSIKFSDGSTWNAVGGVAATTTINSADQIFRITSTGYNVLIDANVTGTTAELLQLDAKFADAVVTDALKFNTSGATAAITDAIDASDTGVTNALNIGANKIIGTTGVIDLTNFDVANTGAISTASTYTTTVAAGNAITVNTDKFLVAADTGNITTGGALTASGALTGASLTGVNGSALAIASANAQGVTLNANTTGTMGIQTTGTGNVTVGNGSVSQVGLVGTTIAMTGNATVSGNLSVTGSLSYGGNWTVGATLTADEVIFDTDGVAPAGTNCYGVRDNAGDLTFNCITGKTINLAVNNTDEYNFGASAADFNGNDVDNLGYLELNATTVPADADSVWIGHDNAGDLNLNCRNTKLIALSVNGTDELTISGAAVTIPTNTVYVGDTANANVTLGLTLNQGAADDQILAAKSSDVAHGYTTGAETDTYGAIKKTVAAEGGVTLMSLSENAATTNVTRVESYGGQADTTKSTAGRALAEVYVTQHDGANALANIANDGNCFGVIARRGGANVATLISDEDGDLWIGGGLTSTAQITASAGMSFADQSITGTTGNLTLTGAGYLTIGANAASAGSIRLSNAAVISFRNQAAGADIDAISVNASDDVAIGADVQMGGNVIYGSAASHTADTADGSLYLHSTLHATKGWVCVPNGTLGLVVGSDGSVDRDGTVGTNAINVFNGTAPVGALVNGISIYSAAGEGYMMDAAGNATLQTPHDEDGNWVFYSKNTKTGKVLKVDMEKLVKFLNKEYGLDFVHEFTIPQ